MLSSTRQPSTGYRWTSSWRNRRSTRPMHSSLRRPRWPAPEPLDLGGLELAPPAGLEPLQGQSFIGGPVEVPHRVADRLAHPFHLPVATLVDRQLDLRRAETACPRGRGEAVLELDAADEPFERSVVGLAVDVDDIRLLDAVARVREPVRERSIVRQQDCAGRVRVETPDGNDALRQVDQVDDGRPSVRIPKGRDRFGRLVEEDVREPLRGDGLAVDVDGVAGPDEGVQPARLAVDADAPGLDELVGATPRRDAGARDVRIETHP